MREGAFGALVSVALLINVIGIVAIGTAVLVFGLCCKEPDCPAPVRKDCTSCEQLVFGPDSEDDYTRLYSKEMRGQQQGEAPLCCVDQSRLIEHFGQEAKKRREERDREHEQCDDPPVTPVNIPDTAEYYTKSQDYNDFQTISDYRPMKEGEFVDKISIDRHGHIVVDKPGEYEIGAQVTFFRPACHKDETTKFTTRLVKQNRHYGHEPFVLTEEIQTKLCKEGNCWMRHSSLINGTYSLYQRDEVYLNVTMRDLVELGGHTFFTIKLVGRKPDL